MERLGTAVLAFILNCKGVYVFRAPKAFDCFPAEAYFLILISVFILLWDTKIYPPWYCKLYYWAEFLIEFAVTMFIMEFVMDDFWLPILGAFIAAITNLIDIINEKMENAKIKINVLTALLDTVKTPEGLYFISITFSTFVLVCVLQATNTVDFHIIRCCGGKAFVKDTIKRSRKFVRKFLHKAKHRCRSRHISFAPGTKEPSDSSFQERFDENETLDTNLEFNQDYRFCRSPRD